MIELVIPAPLRKSTEYAVCTENTIFVSDVAAGMVKIVSPLTGTVAFLQTLGKLRQFWNWCSNRRRGINIPSRCCEQFHS